MATGMKFALVLAALVLATLLHAGPSEAASCFNTNGIPGEWRFDDGAGNCRRMVINADGSINLGAILSPSTVPQPCQNLANYPGEVRWDNAGAQPCNIMRVNPDGSINAVAP